MQLPSAIDRPSRDVEAAAQREASLRRIATLVAGGVVPGDLFAAVAREVSVVLDVPVVTVGRYELDDGLPVSIVLASREHVAFPVGSRWPLDGEGTREIYEDRRPIRIDDFSGLEGTLAEAARRQGMRWVVGAPIIVDGSVWGNIYAGTAGDERIPADAEARLADFTDLVSTAIANSEAREEVHRLAEEQAALRRVATLVARGVQPHEIFSAVSDEVGRVFGSHYAGVARFEPDGSGVVIVGVSDGIGNIPVGTKWPFEDFLATTTVYRTGRPARNDRRDWEDSPGPVSDRLRELGLVSSVVAPILVEGNLWGVISVSDARRQLPADTEDRLAAFTDLVATAIANAESRGELAASEARARELAREQAALRRVAALVAAGASSSAVFDAVAQEVAQLFQFTPTLVARYEDDGASMAVLAAHPASSKLGSRWPLDGPSVAAEVLRSGRPVRIEDWTDLTGTLAAVAREHGWTSVAGAPIIVDGRVWGLVSTVGPPDERLPAHLEDRLAEFTQLVGTAISNSQMHEDLSQLADEQAALRRVATLVAQGASPDELFSAVAREVAGVIDAPVVGINRYEADGTYTIVGNAGESSRWIGTRWPVGKRHLTGMILATGSPARQDDFIGIRGTLAASAGDAPTESWQEPRSTVGVPIIVEGSVWGVMSAVAAPGMLVPAGTEERLARFTELVATAVSNATTRGDLLTSRARLVSAADESRRRLERDLHDGIQQWLVALALRARKAALLSEGADQAGEELEGLAADLDAVTDELREISRGIHPAILSDSGLDAALESLAWRSPIRVGLDARFDGRFDPAVEATVYYVAAESITNAVKHAQASAITLRGRRRNGSLELEIRDDGVGGADPRHGSGIIGLKDRVETLGGSISIASPAGAGTTVRLRLPLDTASPDSG